MSGKTCRQLYELLCDYLEDALPSEVTEEIDVHMERCPDCVAYLNTYRFSVQCIRSVDPPEMPERLKAVLKDVIERHRS